jgi:tetratricopeptide (TPR) repeat protein
LHSSARVWRRAILPALVTSVLLASARGPVLAGEEAESLQQRIDRLIEELGHEKYTVRERAQKALAELGYEAYDALRAAANHEDLEIATRANYLLLLIPAQWNVENEPPLVRDYLAYYQSHPPEQRLAALNDLARMSQGAGTAALCRLVRFEKSTEWSKQAAMALIHWEPVHAAGRARWAKKVREQLGRSARPGAQWLRNYLAARDDPKKAVAEWAKLIEEEQTVLKRSSGQADPSMVAALSYYLALAQAEQGDEASAEETAGRARQFGSIRSSTRLRARIDVALALTQRGRFRWAELEYRHVLDAGLPSAKVRAGALFSETLHDQGDNLAAAKVLEEVLQVDQRALDEAVDGTGRTVQGIRGRMAYFLACHWGEQGDRAKQRQYLNEAVQHDRAELDALIARHQLPDKEPEFHQKTVELIGRAASVYREAIAEIPDQSPRKAGLCNQFAWLVGNTEGDLDEALKCAHKAVELRPDAAAYLDTLAHVYFARGELQEAVKYQTKAAEHDPYSGLIAKKLEVFQNALKQSDNSEDREPDEGEAGGAQTEQGPSGSQNPQPQ